MFKNAFLKGLNAERTLVIYLASPRDLPSSAFFTVAPIERHLTTLPFASTAQRHNYNVTVFDNHRNVAREIRRYRYPKIRIVNEERITHHRFGVHGGDNITERLCLLRTGQRAGHVIWM